MAAAIPFALLSKKPKAPGVTPQATRDDAAAATQMDDELRRRRGSAADVLTGSAGAQATGVTAKALTGQ